MNVPQVGYVRGVRATLCTSVALAAMVGVPFVGGENDSRTDSRVSPPPSVAYGPVCGNSVWDPKEACDQETEHDVPGLACDESCCIQSLHQPIMRAAWSRSTPSEMLPDGHQGPIDKLLDAGIKHFGVKFPSLRVPVGDGDRLTLEKWSAKLNGAGARLWVVFNWFAPLEVQWMLSSYTNYEDCVTGPNNGPIRPECTDVDYDGDGDVDLADFQDFQDGYGLAEPYVGPDGVEVTLKPCPQSQAFWDRWITSRFVAMAELALFEPGEAHYVPGLSQALEGVILDPELYLFSGTGRTYNDPCFCDSCFQSFFLEQGITDPVPPRDERLAYLQTHDLVSVYENFERDAVRDLAAACRTAFRKAAPDLDLEIGGSSIVRFDRSPFYVGLGLGLGTVEKPYYDWAHKTFRLGMNEGIPAFLHDIEKAGVHAVVVGGLLLPEFPPEALADHFYTVGARLGAVWIDRADNFGPEAFQICEPYTLEDYLTALRQGGMELDTLEQDHCYASPYRGEPFVPACTDPCVYDAGPLVPLEEGPAVTEGLLVRRETGYFFWADKNDNLSFEVQFREFINDPGSGWWMLISPSCVVLDTAPLNADLSPAFVEAVATETGVYKLVVNTSFIHGFSVWNASHPGAYRSVLGTQRLGLFQSYLLPPPQFFIYAPAGQTQVVLELRASPLEGSVVQIHDADNMDDLLFDGCIDHTVTQPIVVTLPDDPDGDGTVLAFVIIREDLDKSGNGCGRAEDLDIKFISGALPYLSQTRSGLFREP